MKASEITVGCVYLAKISGNVVRVKVEAIREVTKMGTTLYVGRFYPGRGELRAPPRRDRNTTVYDILNLKTSRRTTFRSAAKFRRAVTAAASAYSDTFKPQTVVISGAALAKAERLARQRLCPTCKGSSYADKEAGIDCPDCAGIGTVGINGYVPSTPVDYWKKLIPDCLTGDVEGARDLEEARHLALCQLDLIEEGQDGTEHYTPGDVQAIKRFIAGGNVNA